MKVLMISGDRNLLTPESDAEKRLTMQKDHVDQLDVVVWPQVHSFWHIVRSARRERYDVVTVQDPFWRGLVGLLVARLIHAKLNVQVHVDFASQSWGRRWLASLPIRCAFSVRAVSERAKGSVHIRHQAKTQVLPIYIDLSRFKQLEHVAHDRPTILWVGRFEKEKDPLRAIEVLKRVREEGVDAKLVMLGAGKLESALRKAAQGLPVDFPGWRPPEEYLGRADVVLCTSPYESWGASIVEALAAGVPVVAPDVGIAREAGAIITDRAHLAQAVVRTLGEKPGGVLRITFLSKEEWGKRWRETLS